MKTAVEEALQPVVESLDALTERVNVIARQRTLAFAVAALGLIVAVVSILYALNREAALQEQITVNRGATCAQAKVTALAPRDKPIAGESRNHYLNRLEAQREQLLAAGGLACPSLPGFATFPYLRAQALDEIEAILRRLAPEKLRKALGTRNGSEATPPSIATTLPSTSPADAGGNAGVGSPEGGASPGGSAPHHPQQPHPPPGSGGGAKGGTGEPTSPPSPTPPPAGNETPSSEAPPEPEPEPEPSPTAKPGALNPVLDHVCEVAASVRLCTPR